MTRRLITRDSDGNTIDLDLEESEHADITANAKRVLNVDESGNFINLPSHDYIAVTYPNNTTEVYTYKSGGSGGTTVLTITLVYTDTTKENLSSMAKT